MPIDLQRTSLPRIIYTDTVGTPEVRSLIMPRLAEGSKLWQTKEKDVNRAGSGRRETLNWEEQWFIDLVWQQMTLADPDGSNVGMPDIFRMWQSLGDGESFSLRFHSLVIGQYPSDGAAVHPNNFTVRFRPGQKYQVDLWENVVDFYVVRFLLEEVIGE